MEIRRDILKPIGSAPSARSGALSRRMKISRILQERMWSSFSTADWLADLLVTFIAGMATGMFVMAMVLYAYA